MLEIKNDEKVFPGDCAHFSVVHAVKGWATITTEIKFQTTLKVL